MKDEIKEILQLIGNCCYHGEISEDRYEKFCNYLTNLQEENNKLKEKINLAENILYDYLYKDGKITEELYLKYKGEENEI